MSTVLSTTALKSKSAPDLAIAPATSKPKDEVRSFREELDSRLADRDATPRTKAAPANSSVARESAEPPTPPADDTREAPAESASDEVADRPTPGDASGTIEEPRASERDATTDSDAAPIDEDAPNPEDEEDREVTSSEFAPEPAVIADESGRDEFEGHAAVPIDGSIAGNAESVVDATSGSMVAEAPNVAPSRESVDPSISSSDEARPANSPKIEVEGSPPSSARDPKSLEETPRTSSPRESTPTNTPAPKPIPDATVRDVPTLDESTTVENEAVDATEVVTTIARTPGKEREATGSREARAAVAVAAAIETTPAVIEENSRSGGTESPLASLARIGADRQGHRGEARREPHFEASRVNQAVDAPRFLESASGAAPSDGSTIADGQAEAGLTAGNPGRGLESPRFGELGSIEFRASGPTPTTTPAPATNPAVADLAGPNTAAESARTLAAVPAPANVPVQQIIAQVQRAIRSGMQELRIRLDPPALGALTVKFALEGDSLAVIVRASRPEVVEALKNDLQGFADMLSKSGIDLTALDVSLDTDTRHDGRGFHEQLEDAGASQPNPNRARTTPRSPEKAERSDATSALLDVMV